MQQNNNKPAPAQTSVERVAHIPIVSCGMSSLDAALSRTPLVRTAYAAALAVSSRVLPYVESASAHFPFAPALSYGDRAAHKTLDLAEQTWPYPFRSQPEQVWHDVRCAADARVVRPAVGVAKSVDQHLAPLVDSFSFVVRKIDADAERKAQPAAEDYQLQRAYALLLVLRDDMLRTANNEENAVIKNIHAILTRLTRHSAALRSHSEDAAARVHVVARAVLAELDKLSPLVASLTSHTSTTLKETATHLRDIMGSGAPLGEKIPQLGAAIQDGVRDVVEDVASKVHELVEDIRSSSAGTGPGAGAGTPSGGGGGGGGAVGNAGSVREKGTPKRGSKRGAGAGTPGAAAHATPPR